MDASFDPPDFCRVIVRRTKNIWLMVRKRLKRPHVSFHTLSNTDHNTHTPLWPGAGAHRDMSRGVSWCYTSRGDTPPHSKTSSESHDTSLSFSDGKPNRFSGSVFLS